MSCIRDAHNRLSSAVSDALTVEGPKVRKGMVCSRIANTGGSVQASGKRNWERLTIVYGMSVYRNMICSEMVSS